MKIIDFARKYDRIIRDNPYVPVLYHIAKPHEVVGMVQDIISNDYKVEFKSDQYGTYMRCREISESYYPIKCSCFAKRGSSISAYFKQIIQEQREYGYFYGVMYDETQLFFTLVPTTDKELSNFGLSFTQSNHRGSDDLNMFVSKSDLCHLYSYYGGGRINHSDTFNIDIKM